MFVFIRCKKGMISSIGIIVLGITSTVLGNLLDNLIYKEDKPLFS